VFSKRFSLSRVLVGISIYIANLLDTIRISVLCQVSNFLTLKRVATLQTFRWVAILQTSEGRIPSKDSFENILLISTYQYLIQQCSNQKSHPNICFSIIVCLDVLQAAILNKTFTSIYRSIYIFNVTNISKGIVYN